MRRSLAYSKIGRSTLNSSLSPDVAACKTVLSAPAVPPPAQSAAGPACASSPVRPARIRCLAHDGASPAPTVRMAPQSCCLALCRRVLQSPAGFDFARIPRDTGKASPSGRVLKQPSQANVLQGADGSGDPGGATLPLEAHLAPPRCTDPASPQQKAGASSTFPGHTTTPRH